MNVKQKKIIEWGIAITIIMILITMILPQYISRINASGKPIINILSAFFFYISIIFFAFLHYFILRKMLKQQYPFKLLRRNPHINPNSLLAPFIAYMTTTAMTLMIFSLMRLGNYYNLKVIMGLLGTDRLFLLLLAPITTGMSLLFSNFYFAKPVKETWKAILLAGIIAGASSFALSYGLWKFVEPYLK